MSASQGIIYSDNVIANPYTNIDEYIEANKENESYYAEAFKNLDDIGDIELKELLYPQARKEIAEIMKVKESGVLNNSVRHLTNVRGFPLPRKEEDQQNLVREANKSYQANLHRYDAKPELTPLLEAIRNLPA